MTTSMPITITISVATVVSTSVKHLAVIGKRARNVQGESMFSDFTMTESEKPILADLVKAGAEAIINELSPFCSYSYDDSNDEFVFKITTTRWIDDDTSNNKDITEALTEAIFNYLYNYTLGQYLSIIHPSTGAKYPPLFGTTYINHCALIIQNIIGICNVKRVPTPSTKTYADVSGKKISSVTINLHITPSNKQQQGVPNATVVINDVECPEHAAEVDSPSTVSYVVSAPGYSTEEGTIDVSGYEDMEYVVYLNKIILQ